MTTILELVFHNTLNILNLFQKYDEDGYPIEDEFEDELESDNDESFDDDDGFDSDDDLEEDSWE